MNANQVPTPARADERRTRIMLLGGMVFLLTTLAALNGGTAPTSSVWDGLKTTLESMLQSSWVLALAMIGLVAAVWQITHGRGYGYLAVVLGLMAVALIGPSFVTTIATATRTPLIAVQASQTARPSVALPFGASPQGRGVASLGS